MRPELGALKALHASLDNVERSLDRVRARLDAFECDPAYAFAHRVTAASEGNEYLRVLDQLDQEDEACT